MGRPLSDITIYYHGTLIKNTPEGSEFKKTINFISDFYHNFLEGYKPPKTSRITLHVDQLLVWRDQDIWGQFVYTIKYSMKKNI
jgi:hypothetical protein